ncbi:MAG: Flp pilus assembly complex ATPase component TadA [Magnetococcales bacterium]|nr:Flp pilus assembly complex ATPase component TadA [Magnetococcales bacterium]MBF0156007.1 Flp pilus assembly complex ATPase component TadA [Magnetococcales bacterium]
MVPAGKPRRRIGELLTEGGFISDDQLHIALTEQKKSGAQLGRIIVTLGFVPEPVMRDLLGAALGEESISLDSTRIDPAVIADFPKVLVDRYRVFPVKWEAATSTFTVAMANTLDVGVLDKVQARMKHGVTVKGVLAGESEISRAIDKYYAVELSLDGILREIETGVVDLESLASQTGEFSHPMVRLVDSLLAEAVRREASDIHIEPEAGYVRIRYRIDGVLLEVRSLHRDFLSGLLVRLKVMAGMNIAETRAPQDGRFSLSLANSTIDFRASSQPTTYGENIVLRILDRSRGGLLLEGLGLAEETLVNLKLMMARPEGIILVTGPTGSGKTTTLYAMLNYLNTEQVNIMTLEDPVEYPMQMVRQTTVNPTANLGFADGIRSILRQDPDIILVGEIRDEDTANMALRAAMTGHQVLSTLHTNSALGALPRLLDIGVTPGVLAGNIIGILGQRLVRRLCRYCKKGYPPDDLERRILGFGANEKATIYRAIGCERCFGMGFRGRMTVMEVLKMDDEFDDLIAGGAPKSAFLKLAAGKGLGTMAEDGVRRVREGSTSLDEISRVLDLSPLALR